MELDVLRWFVEVSEGASVTSTARRHHMSQPALSRALSRLERELGVPLFARIGRSLHCSEDGLILQQNAIRALALIDEAVAKIHGSRASEVHIIRFGFLNSLGTWLAPDLISHYRQSRPGVKFILRHDGAERIAERLHSGELDFILSPPDVLPEGAAWEHLFDERLALCLPPEHRLWGSQSVDLKDVAKEVFVTLQPGYHLRRATDSLCEAAGFQPTIAFEAQDVAAAEALIGAGLGIGLLPQHRALHTDSSVGWLPVKSPVCARPVGIAWVPDRSQSDSVGGFLTFIRAYFDPEDSTCGPLTQYDLTADD